jgi:hypothetical protein
MWPSQHQKTAPDQTTDTKDGLGGYLETTTALEEDVDG